MSEKFTDETESSESKAPDRVAIEQRLPLTAIDIESEKDMESGRYHALRSLHKWFAARPTPAARLSVLASAYPDKIDSDYLLKLMQVGPSAMESDISEYVQNRYAEPTGSGTLDDHYGYPNPNTQSPTESELTEFHEVVRDAWGGELPVILDPTAGRGIIPFEAMRYGFDTKANELNPVPSLILKIALEYAPKVGDIGQELREWRDKIHSEAKENIESYYPTENSEREIMNSAVTYIINCDACGGEIPLVRRWWLHEKSGSGDAIRPIYDDGSVRYEHVEVDDESNLDFDPSDGPLTRQEAVCPHCEVTAEDEDIQDKIRSGEFKYSIYGVNYKMSDDSWHFRAGSEIDRKAMDKAAERVDSDFELMTFMSEPIDVSSRITDPTSYGMEEWRDIFTPRQLVTHFEYYRAYKKFVPEIKERHDEDTARAIQTILTFPLCKCVDHNSRLSVWRVSRGYGANIFGENNFAFKRMFVDNNISSDRRGFIKHSNHAIESYEKIASYVREREPSDVASTDAANLSSIWDEESVDIAVVDPPYYSSIMYAELSDLFYSLQKNYLSDEYPDLFDSKLTNKNDEAVANPYRFEGIANGEESKDNLADEFYEQKMEEIFSEVYELLSPGGVLTVMFTHRDMEAWDTLTTGLINSGFTITASHPIKTEMKDRVGLRSKASVDSSILLIGRKQKTDIESMDETTLWEEVREEFQTVAAEEAKDIIQSGYTISKTDMAIATYGPTLQRFAEAFPVVNKKGDKIRPRDALGEARKAVTSVIAEEFLNTEGVDQLDKLTRWYILAWLTYENDTFPYDEGRQLGVAAGVDIDEIKRPTKLWRGGQEIELQEPEDRVQDIVMLRSDSAENPSSRKYPVDPTKRRFTYTIDTIHAAIHVYEREGARAAWDWLTERDLKSDEAFGVAVTALLEVLPDDEEMHETLVNLISGETGEYLDINAEHIDMSGVDRQTSLDDHTE
jgi:adenine-specific DNA methylase